MVVQTGGRPRRFCILLALLVLLWIAVSALLGIRTPGILSGSLRASEHLALPRLGAVAESARARSYYSISTGMQTGTPRLYHF